MPQVDAQRGGPRPVLHRGGHPGRRLPPGHRPAGAQPPDHLVLGDLGPHRRDLRHLPPDHPGLPRAGQATVAPGTAERLMPDHVIRMIAQPHRRARLPLRPARLPARLLPQRLGRGRAQPVRRRRPRGVLRVLPRLGRKIRDLRLKDPYLLPQLTQPRQLRPQPRDLHVPLGQQLPQPRIGGTQPGSIIRRTGRIGHGRHYTTASPR